MQSKTSLFNGRLISKNLKRFWPLWVVESIIAAIIAFALLASEHNRLNMYMESGYYTDIESSTISTWYSLLEMAVPIVALINAIVIAMVVWNYIYSSRSAYFFHAIPVTRETLFASNFLTGYAMMNIPYAFAILIYAVGTMTMNLFSLKGMLIMIAGTLGENLFFFALATLVAHVTGHILGLPILYLLANFLVLLFELMVEVISAGYLLGIRFEYRGKLEFMCPVVYLMSNVSYNMTNSAGQETDVFLGGGIILIYSLVGVLLCIVAYLIYKTRKSETAGDVISLKVLKPVLHLSITFTGALCGGYLIYLMFSGFNYDEINPIGFSAALVIACVLVYYVLLMLMEKSIKVFTKKTFLPMIVCVAIMVVLNVFMAVDILGRETYIPDAGDVDKVEIYIDGNNASVSPVEDKVLYDAITAAHRTFFENKEMMKQDGDYDYSITDYSDEDAYQVTYCSFQLTYFLKNGSEVVRNYALYIDYRNKENLDVCQQAYIDVLTEPGLLAKLLHEKDEYKLSSVYVYAENDYESTYLENEDADLLWKAVIKDAKAGNWKPFNTTGKVAESNDGSITVSLDFSFEASVPERYDYARTYYDWTYVAVTAKMTNTVEALISLGVVDEKDLARLPKY